jgi:hypothetical protein
MCEWNNIMILTCDGVGILLISAVTVSVVVTIANSYKKIYYFNFYTLAIMSYNK